MINQIFIEIYFDIQNKIFLVYQHNSNALNLRISRRKLKAIWNKFFIYIRLLCCHCRKICWFAIVVVAIARMTYNDVDRRLTKLTHAKTLRFSLEIWYEIFKTSIEINKKNWKNCFLSCDRDFWSKGNKFRFIARERQCATRNFL